MGYETKLYVVSKLSKFPDEEMGYAQVIAMFNMSKCYFLSNVLRDEPKTDCYFYADDGNTCVLEDRYGEPLKETTVEKVVELLEDAIAHGEDYRRIFPLLSALKTIEEQQKNGWWKDIAILHYGY